MGSLRDGYLVLACTPSHVWAGKGNGVLAGSSVKSSACVGYTREFLLGYHWTCAYPGYIELLINLGLCSVRSLPILYVSFISQLPINLPSPMHLALFPLPVRPAIPSHVLPCRGVPKFCVVQTSDQRPYVRCLLHVSCDQDPSAHLSARLFPMYVSTAIAWQGCHML